ncbi:Phage integrase family protein [Bacillus sp. OV194]|nr:Phage integrase family protein [Bacillus sp. OV194]
MVNRINEYLGWEKHERITPHGFRYSIATFLDEKGVSIDSIKYLLGHTERENVRFYLKRDQRKIFQIKKALRELEEELEKSLREESETKSEERVEEPENVTEHRPMGSDFPYTEEFLLKLADKNPDLLEKLLLKHVSK